jgi:hypothetical protein
MACFLVTCGCGLVVDLYLLFMTLRDKILDLFSYRKIPYLMDIVESDQTIKSDLLEKLIAIQTEIYHLDAVLEEDWEILDLKIEASWVQIYKALDELGVSPQEYNNYCRHIYRYQKHELGQRKGKSLLKFNMEYFYFYKSCDVKLIRRLIYERYRTLNKLAKQADWRWFDLITEVNDDVEDYYEDLGTNNGNRYLLQIQQEGIEKTNFTFSDFINSVESEFKRRCKEKTLHPMVIHMTEEVILGTKEILRRRYNELKNKALLKVE